MVPSRCQAKPCPTPLESVRAHETMIVGEVRVGRGKGFIRQDQKGGKKESTFPVLIVVYMI
jgi:hypothetical protein